MASVCNTCKKTESPTLTLKRCAKCSTTQYCSRDCQKADWKAHRKICAKQADRTPQENDVPTSSSSGFSPPKGLDQPIAKPFARLDNKTWLHDRSEKDVYRLLLDAYRLRAEDDYNLEANADHDGIYGGAAHSLRPFRRFLRRAASRPGLLPPWWSNKHKVACEQYGMDKNNWQDLSCAVEKADIIEHYGDSKFPMELRFFAETVLGRGPGGQDGTMMKALMMIHEGGNG